MEWGGKKHYLIYSLKVASFSTVALAVLTIFGYFSYFTATYKFLVSLLFFILFRFSLKSVRFFQMGLGNKTSLILTYLLALVLLFVGEIAMIIIDFSITGRAYFRIFTGLFCYIYLHAIISTIKIKQEDT